MTQAPERSPARARRGLAALPWWAGVLVVHALARAASAAVLLAVARTQEATPWYDSAPGYLEYVGLSWDATWYREIAEQGYPQTLPVGADGRVQQNAWAFFPLFPLLARLGMMLTGGSWALVATLLATACGAGAMLAVERVVRHAVDRLDDAPALVRRHLPLAAVVVATTALASPVLQVAYTEPLALLLVAGTLAALQRRRYALAAVLVVALGLTRAVALPMAVAVLAHALHVWRHRPQDRTVERMLPLAGLGALTVASGLMWPAFVGWATGVPDAYARTQGAWRGRGEVVPFVPWLDVARWLLGVAGPWVLAGVVALAVAAVASRSMRRLGPEAAGWTAGYLAYLLAVVEPGTSTLRFLVLAFPLAVVAADVALRSRARWWALGALVAVGVAGQVGWVGLVWRLVPPSGWPP